MAQQNPPPKAVVFDSFAVTAARSSQPIADVLADITVIGAEEIARAGAQSVTELLARQPGVEIVQNGGPGAVSGVFLRGANRGQTLVLIDGVRIASSSAGATSLEAIPLDQIDRIEILRGPASSLYGADAIGGVVQVFTRRGTGAPSGNASAGYGTYGTWDVKGGVSGATGPVQFALQAAAKGSNGFNTITNPANFLFNPDPDGYSNRSVSANLGFTAAPEQEITGQYFRSRLDNQFDGGPDFDDRTITVAETWQVAGRNRLAPFWVSRLSAGAGIDDSQTQSAYGDSPFKTTQRQYAWQNEITLPAGMLTAGVERREEQVATDAGFATTERNTNSLFGIYQLRVDEHALQANLRRDDSTQYGGKTTGAFDLRLSLRSVAAGHGGLRHRLQGAVVQRPLLPGVRQPGPRAGNVEESGGGRLLERRCRGREPRSARHRLPEPRVAADRLSVRREFQLRAAATWIAPRWKA